MRPALHFLYVDGISYNFVRWVSFNYCRVFDVTSVFRLISRIGHWAVSFDGISCNFVRSVSFNYYGVFDVTLVFRLIRRIGHWAVSLDNSNTIAMMMIRFLESLPFTKHRALYNEQRAENKKNQTKNGYPLLPARQKKKNQLKMYVRGWVYMQQYIFYQVWHSYTHKEQATLQMYKKVHTHQT